MKRLNFLFTYVFLCCSTYSSDCRDIVPYEDQYSILSKKMPFKLGIELQESNNLVAQTRQNYNVQKKGLFGFKWIDHEKNIKLWKIVLDDGDIEFVTKPFSHNEKEALQKCFHSILISFNILKNLLQNEKFLAEDKKITFNKWIEKTQETFNNSSFSLYFKPLYNKIKDEEIRLPSNFKNFRFSPQITIQHPLEYTIPLYYSLLGFDSSSMIQFSAALPLRNQFLVAMERTEYQDYEKNLTYFGLGWMQKINGLVFLQALTLVHMSVDEDTSDTELLEETLDSFNSCGQVDPKLKMSIMSRRPFSSMLKNLNYDSDYQCHFGRMMKYNNKFNTIMEEKLISFNVPKNFNRTNYAEQFFSLEGKVKDMTYLKKFMLSNFVATNEQILDELLKNGLVSTTMIRNFKDKTVRNFFVEYFKNAISTVQDPKKTIMINAESENIPLKMIDYKYDILSPPLFLDFKNSMGRLKDDTKIDKKYGESIVEIRAIKAAGSWFLKKCQLGENIKGQFMVNLDDRMIKQVMTLFDFLDNFSRKKHYLEIFGGIHHATKKL